jgi:hypothetical protein
MLEMYAKKVLTKFEKQTSGRISIISFMAFLPMLKIELKTSEKIISGNENTIHSLIVKLIAYKRLLVDNDNKSPPKIEKIRHDKKINGVAKILILDIKIKPILTFASIRMLKNALKRTQYALHFNQNAHIQSH